MTVPLLVPPGAAVEAHLLFPDPWWKRRHARRRHGPVMAGVLATALAPGGLVVLKSDVGEYLDIIVESFESNPAFGPADLPPDLPLTDRETRIVRRGEKVFAAAFVRR